MGVGAPRCAVLRSGVENVLTKLVLTIKTIYCHSLHINTIQCRDSDFAPALALTMILRNIRVDLIYVE